MVEYLKLDWVWVFVMLRMACQKLGTGDWGAWLTVWPALDRLEAQLEAFESLSATIYTSVHRSCFPHLSQSEIGNRHICIISGKLDLGWINWTVNQPHGYSNVRMRRCDIRMVNCRTPKNSPGWHSGILGSNRQEGTQPSHPLTSLTLQYIWSAGILTRRFIWWSRKWMPKC